jgi:magnesium transporter
VVNTYQRPKLEEHHKHLFIISRAMVRSNDGLLRNDQLSLFVGKNYVITMQDKYEDCFEPLRARIRSGKGNLRTVGSDYLMYSILDSIVDSYFPLLESIGEKLDELEDILFARPTRESLQQIQNIKRELIVFRRTVFAERDKINDLLRSDSNFVTNQTKIYLKDTYDHTIQVMDLVESYKEITASLMDIYLSSVSNRMNGIMKVLAVISTIFIPLTFIVGVYGMNFSRENPETGEVMAYSMPELYSPYGYFGVMIFMLVLVIIQLIIFWKKGWLEKN